MYQLHKNWTLEYTLHMLLVHHWVGVGCLLCGCTVKGPIKSLFIYLFIFTSDVFHVPLYFYPESNNIINTLGGMLLKAIK